MSETCRARRSGRRGFNLIELLFALTLLGILLAFGAPRLATAREHAAVRSARQQVQGYLVAARDAASQRGSAAVFHVNTTANSIWVVGTPATDTIAARRSLVSEFGVDMSGNVSEVRFNSRGFATNLAGNAVIRVSRNGYTDSVCVSRLGAVTTRCGF